MPPVQSKDSSASTEEPEIVEKSDFSDSRMKGDWATRYPDPARREINAEAKVLSVFLVISLFFCGVSLSLSDCSIKYSFDILWLVQGRVNGNNGENIPASFYVEVKALAVFFTGCLGGTTFSIKWLIHSVAKGDWNLDRRYWRYFVPAIGGVYALVVLTLFNAGILGARAVDPSHPINITASLAFLVGYFSDGVSGLLSNVANAVFGTVQKR